MDRQSEQDESVDDTPDAIDYEADTIDMDTDSDSVNYESHPQLAEELIDIHIEKRADQKFGLFLLDNGVVAHIGEKSIAQGKFQPGDLLRTVNGTSVRSKYDCVRELTASPSSGKFAITVSRIQVIQKKPGFTYQHVFINWPDSVNKKLGLNLSQINDMVIVTSFGDGSLAAEHFEIYDRLLTVNHSYIFHKDQAKERIIDCTGRFIALVERPATPETKEEMDSLHKMSYIVPISKDALEFAELEVQRRKLCSEPSLKPALKTAQPKPTRTKSAEKPLRVQFEADARTHLICSDVDPNKRLRSVRSRGRMINSPYPT